MDEAALLFEIGDVESADELEDMPHALLALAWFEPARGAGAAILGLNARSCRAGHWATLDLSPLPIAARLLRRVRGYDSANVM
jgi:hypothetical protein